MRQAEHTRHKHQVYRHHRHIKTQICQRTPHHHARTTLVTQMRRYHTHRPPILTSSPKQNPYTQKQRLMNHQHQQCRHQETRKPSCRRIQLHIIVWYRFHQLIGTLPYNTRHRITLQLHLLHLVHQHRAGTRKHTAIIQETAHVAKQAHPRRLPAGQTVVIITRKQHDTIDTTLLHQEAGLRHVGAMIHHIHLRRRVQLMDKTPARLATRLVNNSHRNTPHHLILIYRPKNQRINNRGNKKDKNHTLVMKHTLHLDDKYIPKVF